MYVKKINLIFLRYLKTIINLLSEFTSLNKCSELSINVTSGLTLNISKQIPPMCLGYLKGHDSLHGRKLWNPN